MDHRRFESTLAHAYDLNAEQYRKDDEIEARSENHLRLGGNLRRICRSFSQPIRVLEIGCGTGRYFHWLQNTDLLVGTDISAEMLSRAKAPLQAAEVTAREIRLMRTNLYEMEFEAGSFDFIYSLGVFGYGADMTPELCGKFERWLTPGGRLYINALERNDAVHKINLKQSIKATLLPVLPAAIQQRIVDRNKNAVPVFNHTREQLEQRMTAAGFSDFMISSNVCHSPLWHGLHLECLARKNSRLSNPLSASAESVLHAY